MVARSAPGDDAVADDEQERCRPVADAIRTTEIPIVGAADRGSSLQVEVLELTGVLDAAALLSLDRAIVAVAGPVVLDLDDCTIVSVGLLHDLDPVRWGRTRSEVCVACQRPSGRRLLDRAQVVDRMTLFENARNAIQALALAESGYGAGWDH